MKVQSAQTASHSELEPYRNLRYSLLYLQQGIFIAEGERTVRRLLESPIPIMSLLVTPVWYESIKLVLEQRLPEDVPVWLAEKHWMEDLAGMGLSQGVLALARIPEAPPIEDHLRQASPFFAVVLDGVDHAVNVGSIVRSCSAFGVTTLLAGGPLSHPYLRRAIRASIGGVFSMPVYQPPDLPETLHMIRDRFGARLIAAEPSGPVSISEIDLSGNLCLVFGSEHRGISRAILDLRPTIASIPVHSRGGSLNVSTAAAIFLYEAARLRAGNIR